MSGTRGNVVCPPGYQLVTNIKECKEEATAALNLPFGTVHCHYFKAVGCFENRVGVYWSTCTTHYTVSNHAPVCRRKGRCTDPVVKRAMTGGGNYSNIARTGISG